MGAMWADSVGTLRMTRSGHPEGHVAIDALPPVGPRAPDSGTTEAVFNGRCPKGFPAELVKVARRTLAYLDAAPTLAALASPPGNRLHALQGDRAGQHAVPVNDQFRICFRWTDAGPKDVEFTDYH